MLWHLEGEHTHTHTHTRKHPTEGAGWRDANHFSQGKEGYSDTSEQDDGVLADTVNLNSIPSKPSAAATRRRAAESSQGLQAIQKMEQNYGHERNCPPKQIVLAQEGRDASNSLDQKISYLGGVRHGLGYDLHVSPEGALDSDALADSDGSEDVLSALEAEGGASEESPGLGARSDGDDDGHGHDSSASVSSERSTEPEGMTGPTPQPPEEHQESRLRRKITLRSVSAARMEHEERVEQWKQLLTSLGKDKEEQLDQAIWDRRRPFIEAFCLSKRGLRLGFEETLHHLVRTAYMPDELGYMSVGM